MVRTREEIRARGHERVHASRCDPSDAASIRAFAHEARRRTDRIDVLLNDGAA